MLTRLILQDFGKFRERSFDLAAMTLVYGPNEAGKTTFFDGLFQALCKPSETKKAGKLLRDRYGSQRRATVEPTPATPWPEDEFLSLYAIRSGDLKLEWSPNSEWMEKLKAGLYHGGVDPRSLAEEFEKKSSDRRNFAHMKELETLRLQADTARSELNGLLTERQGHLRREQDLVGLDAALQETRRLREAARLTALKLESDLIWQEKIQLRQKLQAQWEMLRSWESLDAGWRSSAALRAAKKSDWESLQGATRKASAHAHSVRGKLELQAEARSRAKDELREAQAGMTRAMAWSAKAEEIAQRVRLAMAETIPSAPATKRTWPTVAAGGLVLAGTLAGLAVYSALHIRSQDGLGMAMGAGLAASSVLAAAALFFFGHRRIISPPVTRELPMAAWKDQWLMATGVEDHSLAPLTTPEGILSALEEKSRLRDMQARLEQDAADRMRRYESDYEVLEREFSISQDAEAVAKKNESDWLAVLGARDGEDFLVKYAQAQRTHQERILKAKQIQSLAEIPEGEFDRAAHASGENVGAAGTHNRGAGDSAELTVPDAAQLAALAQELQRKLQTLDDEGVPAYGLDEAGLQRLRNSLKTQRDIEQVQNLRDTEALTRKEGLAGELRGAMGKTAPSIVAAEERLVRAESDLAAKELDKDAAALARDIFRGIGEGTDLLLAGLAQELSGMLAKLLPDERKVALSGLGDKQLKVEDASGQDRILEWLSKGTQDSVVLAAKLAIALKTRVTPGLLVLDDPFLSMDEIRESRGLDLLREFREQGWQIVLLTKEMRLRDKIQRLFPDARVHDLGEVHGPIPGPKPAPIPRPISSPDSKPVAG